MKIAKEKFKNTLESVKSGLANKELITQSNSFCFTQGRVFTYNDEISVSAPIEDLEIEGVVSATELLAFINKVDGVEIDIEIVNNELIMKSGRSKAGLVLQTEIKLPINEVGTIKKWKKLPIDFFEGIHFVMGSCSRDMSTPVITCVHCNTETGILEATDNYCAARYTLSEQIAIKSFLLPANTCAKVLQMTPDLISEGDGWVHFKRNKEDVVLSCRVFDDEFPNIASIIKGKGTSFEFPKNLLQILERAEIFSNRPDKLDESIEVYLHANKCIIKSTSESGWFEEKERTQYEGEELKFSATPYLLKKILKQTVKAQIDGAKLIFKKDNWVYISMLRN